MTTDRELLELAAKAAGIVGEYESWTYQGFNEGIRQVLNGIKCWKPWNPLTDDGDALRLAHTVPMIVTPGTARLLDGRLFGADNNDIAATRCAIVMAAAELGRSMT